MLLSYKRPSQRRGQRSRPLCALLVHTKRKAHTTIAKNPLAYLAAYQTLRWHRRYLWYLGYLRASGGTLDAADTNKGIEEKKKSPRSPHVPGGNEKPSPLSHGRRRPRPCFSLI